MIKKVKLLIERLIEKEDAIFCAAFFFLTLFRISLITGVPKLLLVNSLHDDLFFARAAHYIIHGEWMGPYDQMTLIKVPFFSFFLIFSFFTGLPLFLNETLFYIGACIVLFCALAPLIKSQWWRFLLYVLITFSPVSLATVWTVRVFREFVYLSLTLYVISFSVGLFLRLGNKIHQLLFWVFGLGLSMGAFMITREEGVWIYPALFFLISACLLFIYLEKLDRKILRSVLVLSPILVWYVPIFIVSSLNYSHYGFWGISENLDPDFNRVISTLGRIKTSEEWHPAIQIPHDALIIAYKISPLLNEIRDPLERTILKWNYTQALLSKPEWYVAEYGIGENEINNGNFAWALRDAVYDQGYYKTGKYPQDFYQHLADQLESACDDGRLDCAPLKGIPVVGSIDRRHLPIILRMFYENAIHLLNLDYISLASLDVFRWGNWPKDNNNYKYFEEFIYNPVDTKGKFSEKESEYIVYGKTDLRLKILRYKEKMMMHISEVYKKFTKIVVAISFNIWVISIFLQKYNKNKEQQKSYAIISLFLMGLFFTRLVLLTLIDAATTSPGMGYSGSMYLFIYIFSFLMVYWMLEQLTITLQRRKLSITSAT